MGRGAETLLLANATAGGGRGRAAAETARTELERRSIAVELELTTGPEQLRARAKSAIAEGVGVVAVVGGDGTVQAVAAELADSDTALALIPCGRGNDLARALQIPREPTAAAAVVASKRRRRIDLGRAGGRPFTTVASLGFDATVAGVVHRREVPGRGLVAYGLATLRTLRHHRAVEMRIETGDDVVEGRFFLIAIANTRYYGAGIPIVPSARPDDGVLDVCAVRDVGRLEVLRMLPRLLRGEHVEHPAVVSLRTERLTIDCEQIMPVYADGEPCGETPLTLEAWPRALDVIA